MKKLVTSLVEQEILVLNAANYTLGEMHNYLMIEFHGDTEDSKTLSFESSVAKKLYYILMADLLSPMQKEYRIDNCKASILDALMEIVDNPLLGSKESARKLKNDLINLNRWLAYEATIEKMWFPNIDKEINLKISRSNMIRISGNLNKHDFLKLTQLLEVIQRIFCKNGLSLTEEEAIMSLEHFSEWFNEDILIYHSSIIAEMLIAIQWSIREYLEPLYKKSLVLFYNKRLERKSYRFLPPKELGIIKGSFIHHMYWNLMNSVRDKPIFEKVVTWKYLKMRY